MQAVLFTSESIPMVVDWDDECWDNIGITEFDKREKWSRLRG